MNLEIAALLMGLAGPYTTATDAKDAGPSYGHPSRPVANAEQSPEHAAPTVPEAIPPPSNAQSELAPDTKRRAPNYAPQPDASVGRSLLWVPRVLLFPLYAVTEYGIRAPLTWLGTYAEQRYWPQRVKEFFRFGPHDEATLYPVFSIDLGLRTKVGLYFAWDHAFLEPNSVRLRADTSGRRSYRLRLSDSYAVGGRRFGINGGIVQSNDVAYRQRGPESPSETFRYGARVIDVHLLPTFSGWRSSDLRLGPEVYAYTFDPSATALGNLSLEQAVEQGRLAALPAGVEGYTAVYSSVRAAFDTRQPRNPSPTEPASDYVAPSGTGVRLAGRARYGVDLRRASPATAHEWINYGGVLAGYLDLNGRQRTVGLGFWADLVDRVSGGPEVPFTELPSLGGSEPMPGLRPRRPVDNSSIALQLDYRWPVWSSLDGVFNAALGNVFGPRFAGFDPELLRTSFATGLRTIGNRDRAFELLIGTGTDTFRDGAHLREIRFVAGTSSFF